MSGYLTKIYDSVLGVLKSFTGSEKTTEAKEKIKKSPPKSEYASRPKVSLDRVLP